MNPLPIKSCEVHFLLINIHLLIFNLYRKTLVLPIPAELLLMYVEFFFITIILFNYGEKESKNLVSSSKYTISLGMKQDKISIIILYLKEIYI